MSSIYFNEGVKAYYNKLNIEDNPYKNKNMKVAELEWNDGYKYAAIEDEE
jgi:hypothetical protein